MDKKNNYGTTLEKKVSVIFYVTGLIMSTSSFSMAFLSAVLMEVAAASLFSMSIIVIALFFKGLQNYKFCKIVVLYIVFIFIPFLYYRTGEIYGLTPMCFIILAIFVAFIFSGKTRIVFSVIMTIYYNFLFITSYIVTMPNDVFRPSLFSLVSFIAAHTFIEFCAVLLTTQVLNAYKANQARIENLADELKAKNDELLLLSNTDALTGAKNRRFFMETLICELEDSKHSSNNLCVCLLDIDYFKKVNDTHGHMVGDEVLKLLTKIAQNNLRPSDLFARYGGEEFIIMLARCDITQGYTIAERIRKCIEKTPYRQDLFFTASIGISCLEENDNIETLIERADKNLYVAKESGRNRVIAEMI